jgi:hypothetical protein
LQVACPAFCTTSFGVQLECSISLKNWQLRFNEGMLIRLYPASWCILPCYKNKEFSFLKESFAFLFAPTLGRFVVFGNSDDRKKASLKPGD